MADASDGAAIRPDQDAEAPLVEIGATLITDYDRGHALPWRICHVVSAHNRTCWRFAEEDDLRLFSIHLGRYAFSAELGPEIERFARARGGVREASDA